MFRMRLALKLGMTLAQLKHSMSSHELSQWMAFDRIEPFTVNRVELILAHFMALVANLSSKSGSYKPADFLPFKGEKKRQKPEAMETLLRFYYGRNQSVKR